MSNEELEVIRAPGVAHKRLLIEGIRGLNEEGLEKLPFILEGFEDWEFNELYLEWQRLQNRMWLFMWEIVAAGAYKIRRDSMGKSNVGKKLMLMFPGYGKSILELKFQAWRTFYQDPNETYRVKWNGESYVFEDVHLQTGKGVQEYYFLAMRGRSKEEARAVLREAEERMKEELVKRRFYTLNMFRHDINQPKARTSKPTLPPIPTYSYRLGAIQSGLEAFLNKFQYDPEFQELLECLNADLQVLAWELGALCGYYSQDELRRVLTLQGGKTRISESRIVDIDLERYLQKGIWNKRARLFANEAREDMDGAGEDEDWEEEIEELVNLQEKFASLEPELEEGE